MRTQFLRKNRRYLTTTAAVKFAAAFLVVFIIAIWRLFFPNAFLAVAAPVSRLGTALSGSIGDFSAGWSDKAALARKSDALASALESMTEDRDKLAAQVATLTAHEGTRGGLPPGVLASVLIRPPIAPYDSVVVDLGSSAGISVGDLALSDGGTPVGRVTSVTKSFARVTLFSSSGVETETLIGASHFPATLIGVGSGGFAVALPKAAGSGSGLAVGDTVYYSYDGATPIGSVRSLMTSPSSVSETLLISGDVNPFSLVWLTIVPYASTLPTGMTASTTSSQ